MANFLFRNRYSSNRMRNYTGYKVSARHLFGDSVGQAAFQVRRIAPQQKESLAGGGSRNPRLRRDCCSFLNFDDNRAI